jgi:hypothetical protein
MNENIFLLLMQFGKVSLYHVKSLSFLNHEVIVYFYFS